MEPVPSISPDSKAFCGATFSVVVIGTVTVTAEPPPVVVEDAAEEKLKLYELASMTVISNEPLGVIPPTAVAPAIVTVVPSEMLCAVSVTTTLVELIVVASGEAPSVFT